MKKGPFSPLKKPLFAYSNLRGRPHESFEKRRVPGKRFREHFGMPLHAENEGKGGVFQGLNDAVGTLRDDVKRGSGRLYGLMVLGVDGEIFLPDDRGEKRAGNDFNLVHGFNVVALLTVGRKGEAELFGNVLDERTARDDVQNLESPADREDGKSFAQRRADERTL